MEGSLLPFGAGCADTACISQHLAADSPVASGDVPAWCRTSSQGEATP